MPSAKYPTEVGDWKKCVKDKWILLDSDVFISFNKFSKDQVLKELDESAAGLLVIHPIVLELLNTNNKKDKLWRVDKLTELDITELPLDKIITENAKKIQDSLSSETQPSPTDLYIGGTLAKYNSKHGNALLITANIKDFPMPLFTREGNLILQDEKKVKVLSVLGFDSSSLVKV